MLPFVLLANLAPAVQAHVLGQMRRPKFVVADTMDLWLNIALPDLLKLLKRVDGFVLNDSEARLLTKDGQTSFPALKKIHRLGPRYTSSSKKASTARFFPRATVVCSSRPRIPLRRVVDPTGAGDSFVGGMMGYLASAPGPVDRNIRRAMVYGSVVASFSAAKRFRASNSPIRVTRAAIQKRFNELAALTKI